MWQGETNLMDTLRYDFSLMESTWELLDELVIGIFFILFYKIVELEKTDV